jgi:Arc/MetJ-type ribon-helix-helix transcriptional regulator
METSSFRLPPELVDEIAVVAKRRGVTRSEIVRDAVARYLAEAGSAPHLTRLEALDALLGEHPGSGRTDTATNAEARLRALFSARRSGRPRPKRSARAKARPRR